MLFNSYVFFLAFMPVFLVLFLLTRRASYIYPGMRSVCKWIVIAGSLIFYAPFGVKNLLVLVGSIAANAVLGAFLSGSRAGGRLSRGLFTAGIVMNLSVLIFFKYSGVITGQKIFFPIAISFYTFNQISFLAEVRNGECKEFSLEDYLSYILFFPKLVQGPLMGYKDFCDSLCRSLDNKALDWESVMRGLYLFSMGLFKKVIMADTFGRAVNMAYGDVSSLGSLEAVLTAVFYSFQLYFDFSGYCDMATGICMIMGFDLPLNFDSPYKAVNIVDFWKRWHITLTRFFTGYVYIPLGGNRKGEARMYLNFMAVFLLSGLWHGNGINFILWGAMHGALFVITRKVLRIRQAAASKPGAILRMIGIFLTFVYVTAAWVFFRAPTVSDALTLLNRIFTGGTSPIATRLSSCFQLDELWYIIKVTPLMKLPFAWDLCLWLFVLAASIMIFGCRNAVNIAKSCKIGIKTTLLTAFLLLWSVVSFAGVSTFIYMNF